MMSTLFRPQKVAAFTVGVGPVVSLEMCEDGELTKELTIQFADAEALVKFGRQVAEEGWNLIRERREARLHHAEKNDNPAPCAGCGEEAP